MGLREPAMQLALVIEAAPGASVSAATDSVSGGAAAGRNCRVAGGEETSGALCCNGTGSRWKFCASVRMRAAA